MKIPIDFSVISKDGDAVGNVEGKLDFENVPELGDSISFLFPLNNILPNRDLAPIGLLEVTDRIFIPGPQGGVTLMLSDLVADTREHALKLMNYFESGFDLHTNIYNEDRES
jgi:hypothetical protein